jgi:hypothetical protein
MDARAQARSAATLDDQSFNFELPRFDQTGGVWLVADYN